ncbi:SRPBCC family protein [Anthocerotibacter panamensis]|uniref:SRPBCC family protein n=1 Tax=Anthocerotibacter panamensis TaxID=2857077 RepID=UPI001C40256D|nr:SRPBCC family protein [Anthocerotibacter panamensis]
MAIGTSDTAAAHGNHRVSIAVQVPPQFAYRMWTQFERFPSFFKHIQEVTLDPKNPALQHWRGTVLGFDQEWDAEITTQVPEQVIAWRSVKGFANSGSLTFERTDAGATLLTVQIGYDPPLGALGDIAEIIWVSQRFDNDLEEDLTQFKALAERLYAQTQNPEAITEAVLEEARATQPPAVVGEKDIAVGYETSHIPQPNVITTQELRNRLDWGEIALTILDVRPLEAFRAGHIRGANTAPAEVVEERAYDLAGRVEQGMDRQILVYSDRDGLSAQAATQLRAAGYTLVLDYVDGFSAWQEAGLPVETQAALEERKQE